MAARMSWRAGSCQRRGRKGNKGRQRRQVYWQRTHGKALTSWLLAGTGLDPPRPTGDRVAGHRSEREATGAIPVVLVVLTSSKPALRIRGLDGVRGEGEGLLMAGRLLLNRHGAVGWLHLIHLGGRRVP